jgi:TonB family protein
MKRSFLLMALIAISLSTFSQTNKKYYNKAGHPTSRDSCYTYRFEKDYNPVDTVRNYFCKDDRPQSVYQVNESGAKNGFYREYFPSGKLKFKATFHEYAFTDSVYAFYPDGSLHYIEHYGKSFSQVRILYYRDSTGTVLIENGEGTCNCNFNGYHERDYFLVGRVKYGLMDSVWTVNDVNGRKRNEEIYRRGKFISGRFFNDDGQIVDYTVIEESAAPREGIAAFYGFIGKNIAYPKQARKQKIQGKVFVEFIVERDGSVTKVKTIKGIGGGCDEEAERVIALSPKWIPGRQRGKTVRQKMVLPINFKLG